MLKKYFIDEFLRLLSQSSYATKFVWKGGFVLSAITGIGKRTTVDLDTLLQGVTVNRSTLTSIMNEVIDLQTISGCQYTLINVQPIQEEKAYSGLRVSLSGQLGQIQDRFHLDIATGETLRPAAVKLDYQPLIGEGPIPILVYRTERILAEKLQTILARSIANTRMKDFYDVYIMTKLVPIDSELLVVAFRIVMQERETQGLEDNSQETLDLIRASLRMQQLWKNYAEQHAFVEQLTFEETVDAAKRLLKLMG